MTKSQISLVECIVGVFAFDEQNEDIDACFFSKNVEEAARSIRRLQKGESVDEVIRLVERLYLRGYREFVFETECLAKAVEDRFDVKVTVEELSRAGEHLRSNLGKLAIKWGIASSLEEFYALSHSITTTVVKMGVKEASGKKDLIVMQAVLTLDDLDKSLNLFTNRLREWYGYYFPELGSLVRNSAIYTRLVASIGERQNFTLGLLTKMGVSAQRAAAIATAAKTSMGGELSEKDIAESRSLTQTILELDASRSRIERYLDGLMKEIAPNISELGGSTLGARLIAKVGGLENLSKKSSSTIQILGAEAALFRSLKTGAPPPKHGLIFQHKQIHQSPKWQRGKIARALAGKLAIAARLDAYGGRYLGDNLKEDFLKRVKEIKTKRAKPLKKD